jgi:hypothetical protein
MKKFVVLLVAFLIPPHATGDQSESNEFGGLYCHKNIPAYEIPTCFNFENGFMEYSGSAYKYKQTNKKVYVQLDNKILVGTIISANLIQFTSGSANENYERTNPEALERRRKLNAEYLAKKERELKSREIHVTITSEPSNAMVSLNGMTIGYTPIIKHWMMAGEKNHFHLFTRRHFLDTTVIFKPTDEQINFKLMITEQAQKEDAEAIEWNKNHQASLVRDSIENEKTTQYNLDQRANVRESIHRDSVEGEKIYQRRKLRENR